MSAQKPVQSDDPIELLADSMNVWVGKLSDIVHKVIDTEPIVIEGTITKKMAKRLRMIYDQMAIPRYVIAMGDCAISGGLFHDSYSIVNGAHEFLPVDVFVAGC